MIFFMVGEKEVCIWFLKKGGIVEDVVGGIYIDFVCGFIWVEMMMVEDFVCFGSECEVKV